MIITLTYLFVGWVMAALQEEPEKGNRLEESMFMYWLMFITFAWPLYVILWLIERSREDV